MAKSWSELLAVNEATELKRDDIFNITQDGSSAGIRSSIIESTINATIIRSQDDFNEIIERVAANQYKIKNGIYAIYVKILSDGYKMHGVTSPLSGGDTWGYIETNECSRIIFVPGAYIDMGVTEGYIKSNTNGGILKNVWIKGDIGTPAAIITSFLLDANDVTYERCISSDRNSNVTFEVFKKSSTNEHNETVQCDACIVRNLSSNTTLYGFRGLWNVHKCTIRNINTAGPFFGIAGCNIVTSCKIIDIIATSITYCIVNVNIVTSCYIRNITTSGTLIGIENCDEIANNNVTGLVGTGSSQVQAYNNINNMAVCEAREISNDGGNVFGISGSNNITACFITDIISNTGNAYGINAGNRVGECRIANVNSTSGLGYGYISCNYITKSAADNCKTDGFEDCDNPEGCLSTNNSGNGFNNCIAMGHNRSTGNGTNYSATCFADWGGTIAVADSATGGYNG